MPGFVSIGSTPIGMILRRVVIRAGAIRADAGQAPAAAGTSAAIAPEPIALDLAKLSGGLVPSVSIQPEPIELQAFDLPSEATASGSIDLVAIDLQAIDLAGLVTGTATTAADACPADLVAAGEALVPTIQLQPQATKVLGAASVADPTAAAGLVPGAIHTEGTTAAGQLQAGRTIPADPLEGNLEIAAGGLVPSASIQPDPIELQAFDQVTDNTAGGSIDLVALESASIAGHYITSSARTIPADAVRVDPRPAIANLVYAMIIQGGGIELQAYQLPRQATAGGSIEPEAVTLLEGVSGGLVGGSRAIPAGLIAADLVAASEVLVPAAAWQAFAVEVLESASATDPTAAVSLAPGAIELQAGQLVDQASGSIELQAFGFDLRVGTGNPTPQTELRLQFFSFSFSSTPGQAERDASGTIAAGIHHAAAEVARGQLQAGLVITADALEVDLEKTAGGLVPSVSLEVDPVELQAWHLVTDTTAGGSIDLAAIELEELILRQRVIGPRTIPFYPIAVETAHQEWRGFGPVLIAPPELVYTLPSAWPYYCLADNRLAFDLDNQRLAFDLVDNRLGYDLGLGWYQFDLRDNLLIYRVEE